MSTSKAKSFAKATGKLALAATVAALWMAAGPIAGAAADGYPISAARATGLQACSGSAEEWGYAFPGCIGQHWQAEEMAKRVDGFVAKRSLGSRVERPWRRITTATAGIR